MFQPGDMIIYGQIGVCRITDISVPDFSDDAARLYYTLEPLQQKGTVFVPTDSPVFMRPVMSREEAEAIIDLIPTVRSECCSSSNLQQLNQFYGEKLRSHRCEDLIAVISSIYAKKQERNGRNRHIGAVDEAYLKRAEALFHGELAYVLGIPESEVSAYISARIRKKKDQ